MITLKRNRQKIWYSLYLSSSDQYDEYDNDTGEPQITYSDPVMMEANVSPATGNATTEQFGIIDNYDKIIVTHDMNCPIDENSVLFIDKEPEVTDPKYDYVVRNISRSLNSISIAVSKVDVG